MLHFLSNQDIGLAHIGNGLSDQSELCQGGLCSLILWNNGLTHEGMGYLSDGLVRKYINVSVYICQLILLVDLTGLFNMM